MIKFIKERIKKFKANKMALNIAKAIIFDLEQHIYKYKQQLKTWLLKEAERKIMKIKINQYNTCIEEIRDNLLDLWYRV